MLLSADVEGIAELEGIAEQLAHTEDVADRARLESELTRVELSPEDLATVLAESEQDAARAWAAHALGRRNDDLALRALLDAIDDESELVRGEVYKALGRRDDPEVLTALKKAAVRDPSARLRDEALEAAKATLHAEQAVDVPTEIARLQSEDVYDAVEAAERLGEAGDWRAVEPLIAAASKGDPTLRKAALLSLGHLGDPRAVDDLCQIAVSTAGPIRYHALAALAYLADDGAVPTLTTLLADSDPWTRTYAVRALAWTAAPGTAELLIGVLDDPEEQVRIEVLVHSGRIGAPYELLVEALDDPSPIVRSEAVRLLAEGADARTPDAVRPLLNDKDALVRIQAAHAAVALFDLAAAEDLRKLVKKTKNEDERAVYEGALQALGG
jgi:HEAT repeat protein